MKISVDQLLKQTAEKTLAPCYWLMGDEILQKQECRAHILQCAKHQGFNERSRLALTNDVSVMLGELAARSLFSKQRIVEIDVPHGKINEIFSELLLRFCQKPNPGVLLLIHSPKLETGATQSRAYKAFDAIGVAIQSWPIPINQLPKFFTARLAQHGLCASADGLQLLSTLTEGNLLYAAQSVEKLALFYATQQTPLTVEQIASVVISQAHFDIFQLCDAFFLGDKIRALRICRTLSETNHEIMMVWGALWKDIRVLCRLACLMKQKNFEACCAQLGIWEQRKPVYRAALQRIYYRSALVKAMAAVDQLIKNPRLGDPWLALERLIIKFIV
jgi:DNA polymerase III subunit delta